MVQLNTDPASQLATLLSTQVSGLRVYTNNGIPTSGIPDEFVSIDMNGGIQGLDTKKEVATCVLAVSIYEKLLSTGSANTTKANILLGKFQSIFDVCAKTTGFTFMINPNSMVYDGKSILSGYSTKVLNINVIINN